MSNKDLIEKIMTEVTDENLRDKLLAAVTDSGSRSHTRDSVVLNELEKLGINPNAAKEVVGFQLSISVIVGYIVGGLFLVGGGLISLLNLLTGHIALAIVFGIPAFLGWYAIVSSRKFARLRGQQ